MRKRGRPKGSTSWHNNPVAWAGHHLNWLIELQLSLARERRYTVPPKDKRVLAEKAVRHAEQLIGVRPDIDAVIAWARRNPPRPSLRRKSLRWKAR